MPATLKFPGIPAGLTMTAHVRDAPTNGLLETITLTEVSGEYTATTSLTGPLRFELLVSGTVIGDTRIRTISDGATIVVDSTSEILSKIDTGGSGPNAVTITIEDDSDDSPLQNATVRLTEGVDNFTRVSDSNGEVAFGLQPATYSVVVTKTGYDSYLGTLTVSSGGSHTIQLTATGAITPPAVPGRATGVMTTLDEKGDAEEDVPVTVQFKAAPEGVSGFAYDTKPITVLSDSNGLVQFPALIHGATYTIKRGTAETAAPVSNFGIRSSGTQQEFVVPAVASFELPSVTGRDAE